MNLDASTIFAGLVFGSIGFSAFLYGRKISEWKPMVLGVILIAYPYFIPGALWQWVVGGLLTVTLFIFR